MRGKAHTPNCKNELVHKYDGRKVSSLRTQFELEDLARAMDHAFCHNGNGVVLAYAKYLKAQPAPRQRHAIYLLLTKDSIVCSCDPEWFVVPENNNPDRLPVDWTPIVDADAQLLVVVCVSGFAEDGKPRTVKHQAVHMIDALME